MYKYSFETLHQLLFEPFITFLIEIECLFASCIFGLIIKFVHDCSCIGEC